MCAKRRQHNDEDVPAVTVSAERDDDTMAVAVADNGPGVPDDRKADIFGKSGSGLDSRGTGIGLHLVQTLVDKGHCGMRVSSEKYVS